MKIVQSLAAMACGAMLLAVNAAQADTLTLRTGVDASNTVLAAGTLDPKWSVSLDGGASYSAAKVAFPAQICCGMEGAGIAAAWITDASVTAGSQDTAWGINHDVHLRVLFDLSGLDASTAVLIGIWRIADSTSGVLLNGHSLVDSSSAFTFAEDHNLPANAGLGLFNAGVNSLEFLGSSVNSAWDALWFDGNVSASALPAAVPLPGAVWMLAPAIGLLARRRRPA